MIPCLGHDIVGGLAIDLGPTGALDHLRMSDTLLPPRSTCPTRYPRQVGVGLEPDWDIASICWDGSASSRIEAPDFPGRQGRLALAAITSKLRKLLTDAGLDGSAVLDGRDGSYELRFPAGTWIDLQTAINSLDRAEGLLRRGRPAEASVASSIFRRPFLSGESGEWVERMRRDLHEYEVRTFDALGQVWLALERPVAALQAARRVVDLVPFRESAHARVMECHLAAGDRAEAVRVYGRLREMLEETMGLSPNDQTEDLYAQALG